MAHSSDSKANTVHSRAKRSCLNCEKYFIPKNSLPKYVEGRTTQTWCSKACYVILYPQVVEEVQCPYCPTMFVPRNRSQVTCTSEECKVERRIEQQRKRREDPEFREKRNKKSLESYHINKEDPEFRKKKNKMEQERYHINMEDPEFREKRRKKDRGHKRKRMEDPEFREKKNKKQLGRYREDPEYREKRKRESRELYHRNKEKSDGSQ